MRGEKVTAAFDDDRLISDGGVLVLAQAEPMMGICERLAACIPDPRAVARMIYRLEDIPRACECLARLSGLSPGAALASPPTMSRGESAPTTQELAKMLTAMIDISSASHPVARAAVRLDIDDTCNVVRGCQQLSFWKAIGELCFLPIHVYDIASHGPCVVLPSAAAANQGRNH
jgi:hypothetical protein